MNCKSFEIVTSFGAFTVNGDGYGNCHHFHKHKDRISLWGCEIIDAKIGDMISGRLKNGMLISFGRLKFKKGLS